MFKNYLKIAFRNLLETGRIRESIILSLSSARGHILGRSDNQY